MSSARNDEECTTSSTPIVSSTPEEPKEEGRSTWLAPSSQAVHVPFCPRPMAKYLNSTGKWRYSMATQAWYQRHLGDEEERWRGTAAAGCQLPSAGRPPASRTSRSCRSMAAHSTRKHTTTPVRERATSLISDRCGARGRPGARQWSDTHTPVMGWSTTNLRFGPSSHTATPFVCSRYLYSKRESGGRTRVTEWYSCWASGWRTRGNVQAPSSFRLPVSSRRWPYATRARTPMRISSCRLVPPCLRLSVW
mmetsp:Transcript_9276/g.38121  ORF Transcript_9276/g.38121 Transcript_9276/m.38121 type:complete len:250 (+) Transcript_9276:134-883(+)